MNDLPGTPGAGFRPDPDTVSGLEPMLELLAASPASLSSVTDRSRARDVHVSDSLSGLILPEVADATRAADIGTGGGFPGVPLAFSLPGCRFTLVDSVGRKVDFVNEVIAALGLANAEAVKSRSEELASGDLRESFDLVTARAVAPLDALAELASPLLREDGHLVAWKGEREPEGEAALARIADRVAMRLDRVEPVRPYSGSRQRHLYVIAKTGPTPPGLPRRPGMERKRPLSGRTAALTPPDQSQVTDHVV